MGLINKLLGLGKRADQSRSIYHIIDLDYSELDTFPNGITEMGEKKIDGFIIRNVLSKAEVNVLIENYEKVPETDRFHNNAGMIVYPPPFSKIDQSAADSKEQMEKFYIEAVPFWENFPNRFGVDLVKRVSDLLEKIGGGRKVEPPKGMQNIGMYNPATFKHLVPGEGEFKPHCGNFFHKEFPTFYAHLNEISQIKNQMSYFLMLSPSQSGGELTLYDVLWEDAEIRHRDTLLETHKGKILDLNNKKQVKCQFLKPKPGDMIVFSGGRIWHKVERAEGTQRYTIGGFLTRSKDDKTIYIWS